MKICYYLIEDMLTEELEIFDLLRQKVYSDIYYSLKQEKLELKVYYLKDSITPFQINQEIASEMSLNGITKLPIVTINDKIIKKGNLLSSEELSKILDIGISLQTKNIGEE